MLKKFIKDTKKYFVYTVYAAKARLKAEVEGSYLNWIWWILEPICYMLIYALVFGFIFGATEQYYIAFVFIGVTFWQFFNKNIKKSVKLIRSNKAIVTKIYVPKFVLILTQMFVEGFKMLISFGIVIVLMIIFQVPISFNIFWIIAVLIVLWVFTFGLMCILTHFGVFVEDLEKIVTIVLRLVFYISGVMYDIADRLGKAHEVIASILNDVNPMAFLMTAARKCLLYSSSPDLLLLLGWLVVSVILCLIGIHLIYKNENGYVKVI